MPVTRAMAAARAANNGKLAQHTEDHFGEPPSRKRMKTKDQTTNRTNKVSFSGLLDLPLEVFNEIAVYLLPMDLLSLARTNNFFRGLLMSRESQRLWEGALENLPDLPPCPPHLSEPKYVSLLFSKTCSSCGAIVLHQMDPYLYVRLCDSCCDKELMEVRLFHRLLPYIPKSNVFSRAGYVHTFPSEFSKASHAVEQRGKDFQKWRDERDAELHERWERSVELADYLETLEREREMELEDLKRKRQNEIEARLLKKGWTRRDMEPSPSNSAEWQKLVFQPKSITNRVWANLYPKLQPLLNSNRIWNDQVDKASRRHARIKKIQDLVETIISTLPPLAHLTLKSTPNDDNPAEPSTAPTSSPPPPDYPDIGIEQAFPSTAEILTWPIIKRIVDSDTSPEDAGAGFEEVRGEFDRRVMEWRERVEQDLVDIWNAGRGGQDEGENQSKSSKRKGKGKAVAPAAMTNSRNSKRITTIEGSAADSVKFNFPEFVATFTNSNGTTTTNLSDLSPNLRLLLRADTVFKSAECDFNHNYPDIVPRPLSYIFSIVFRVREEFKYGERWDASDIQRDNEAATLAKVMLALIDRPDATSVEMKALGESFLCGRCNWMVYHYAAEQGRWKQAQAKIKAEPKAGFVFNSTHDLEPGNPRPFARFLTPQAASDYAEENSEYDRVMMTCMRCDNMGIQAQYFHIFDPGFESPMREHLHDVHGVIAGNDFQPWLGNEARLFNPSEPDEEDYYSDEEMWGIFD